MEHLGSSNVCGFPLSRHMASSVFCQATRKTCRRINDKLSLIPLLLHAINDVINLLLLTKPARVPVSDTFSSPLAAHCLSPGVKQRSAWWKRWTELDLPHTDGPRTLSHPSLLLRYPSVSLKTGGSMIPEQGALLGCHSPPLHCLHLLKHLRYLSSRATHLLFI